MTGLLNEKEFSRKSFLKGGGALVVGFSLAGPLLGPGKAAADVGPYGKPYASVIRDLSQVDSYIVIHADNTCSILCGGMDNGTGSSTGWLMLAAEELNMDLSQVKYVLPDTGVTAYPQRKTNSSQGTKNIGAQLRTAAAYAGQELVRLASVSLGVPVASLTVKSGVVSGGGKSVTYGQLLGDKLFKVTMPVVPIEGGGVTAPYHLQGEPPLKPVSQYKVVGKRVPRFEIPDMVTGKMTYSSEVRVPGMLHGRIVLPRGQGAYGSGAKPLSVDESSIKHIRGVQVVRRGDFVGVVSANEWAVVQAAEQLKVTWADPPTISSSGNLWKQIREHVAAGQAVVREGAIGGSYGAKAGPVGNIDAALKSAAHVVSATYSYPYQFHGAIGPEVAIADVQPNGCLILCYQQGGSNDMPPVMAPFLGLPVAAIRGKEFYGSSTYGGGGNKSVPALPAAVMSQIVGKPVRVQNTRFDQHGWDTFGPPHLIDMRGGVDANGNIVAYEYTSHTVGADVGPSLTQEQLGGLPAPNTSGPTEESANGVQYELPNWRMIYKTAPRLGNYFKTGPMRASHSAQTTFGTEVFADELAYAAKMDPIAFRRQNVRKTQLPGLSGTATSTGGTQLVPVTWSWTERFLGVLNAVAQASNWQPRVAASNLSDANVVTGRGVSFGPRAWPHTFSAAVAEIEVNKKTGKILVKHLYGASDQGLTVNPMGVENQMEGSMVMNVSRALLEEVAFNTHRVTSLDWVTYPILRFKDAPQVTTIIVNRPEIQMAGAGDHVMAHVPAAIANAFFDATGVRIRSVPMTPVRVRATLKAAGVA
jgi:nicotinate dehydrogenase subunit B